MPKIPRGLDFGAKLQNLRELAATVKVTDDIAAASPTTNIAFALGPEDVKVEFVEVRDQKAPIQLHHIHFFSQQNTEMHPNQPPNTTP